MHYFQGSKEHRPLLGASLDSRSKINSRVQKSDLEKLSILGMTFDLKPFKYEYIVHRNNIRTS